jgi:trehalose 6-phosphate phosphatase
MVLELAPADTPGKGSVILREARARNLAGCLFAGDDRADLAAFAALDELEADGTVTVKVAVKSEETPQELIDEADIVVERPSGLLELLARL